MVRGVDSQTRHRVWVCADCLHSCRADLACEMALDAVKTVAVETGGRREIDIKRYAKVEKVLCSEFGPINAFCVPVCD